MFREILLAAPMLVPATVARATPEIRWEPYSYETRTGDSVTDGELGRITVPERHGANPGGKIELAFVRFRSTAENPSAPIVWLAGGPSDFGSDDIEGPYLDLVREFQKVGDVIALDQRGTGLTRPLLDCPENSFALPLDRPYDRELAMREYVRLSQECAEHFAARGIDLSAYNTVESAHDVEALRRALGVRRVHLYGASYGSHLAFAVLRHHPDSVDRVVLSGIEGPDHTWKLPSNVDRFLEKVFALDPELETKVRTVLKRLEESPVTVAIPGENGEPGESITIGAFDVQLALRAFYGSTQNLVNLPGIFSDLYEGNYEAVAGYLGKLRNVGVGSAMYYCMDCASGASADRRTRIDAEVPGSVAGALNFPFPGICAGWPHADLGDEYRRPLRSDRPTLFVSAALDGQTPPTNAEEMMTGFTHRTHILVEGASHTYTELDPPELTRRLAAFFSGETGSDTTFVLPFELATTEGKD